MRALVVRGFLLGCLVCAAAPAFAAAGAASAAPPASARFAVLVDRYLDRFGHYHPSISAGNGIHGHDAELEDFSAGSIASELRWLRATRVQLGAFSATDLTPDEEADRRILAGVIDGWILDLDTVRTWQRNPMVYVAAVSDGLHDLVTMEAAPAEVRMRFALGKLKAVPGLLAAVRQNVKHPPRVFVERTIAMLGGVADLLGHDLPLAFAGSHDEALKAQLSAAARVAGKELGGYRHELETSGLAAATGSYVVGIANVEARYRAEELIDLTASQMLSIGYRELATKQAEFTATATKIDPAHAPIEVWHGVQDDHPAQGQLVPAARAVVDELFAFIEARHLVALPPNERVVVAPAPAYDLGLASMHSSPPLEPHPIQSFYYVTDAEAGWPAERQNAWLRTFNYATLADISAHEVAPGHYVHSLFMRKTPGKIRRIWVGLNPFPQPSSGQDGWAHYAEQMVSDEGFKADQPRFRLGQIAESLTRICRLIAGLKLHSGEWTVEEAAGLFEREAHMEPLAARREAVRGTYDPT